MKPGRTEQLWVHLLKGKMNERAWEENFRMNKDNFYRLVSLIRPYVKERSNKIRTDSINLEKRVAITLYYLKDQGSMKMVANTFGIARCTVGQIIFEICGILAKYVGPELIKFPVKRVEIEEGSAHFLKRFGFPNVIGCIDGTHIPVREPTENPHD